jgi:glycosyltransferase involved in cell wall biosynthesis
MKVLHIIPSISSKRGGPSIAVMKMVKALRNEGVDASILTTTDNSIYREIDHPLGRWFTFDDIPILIFPVVCSRIEVLNEYLISPRLSCWLIQNIEEYDAIHIHAIFSYSTTVSMLIARLKNIPYIVRTIGQLNSWSLSQSRIKKLLMLSLIEHRNLMAAMAIHVTSKSEMEDLKKICDHKNVLCLELGVDLRGIVISEKRTAPEIISFIFLSRIHPKKRLDNLLEAFSFLSKEHDEIPWKLFIAGSGDSDYIFALKKLAEEYGINDSIEWMGHLNQEKKLALLKSCDWYVLPSISENFGLSVVEALACGLPVIISEEVGISDIILENKAGLVTGISLSLVDALKFAVQGAPLEMKKAAVKLAREKFSWDEIGKKLSFFYKINIKERTK